MTNIKKIIYSVLWLILISLAMICYGLFAPYKGILKLSVYQGSLLILVLFTIALFRWKKNSSLYTKTFGNVKARGTGIKFLLVKEGASWLSTGLWLIVIVSLALLAFMLSGFIQMGYTFQWRSLIKNLHWIIIFSLSNAFCEEIIYRFVPIEILGPHKSYPWISAIIFGLAHIAGNPGGVIGMLMSGILGFILAKSVADTRGMFWAFIIHLIQDLIIFALLFGFMII